MGRSSHPLDDGLAARSAGAGVQSLRVSQPRAANGRFVALPAKPVGKRCSRCDTEKPAERFYRRHRSRDGLSVWCKDCYALYGREWAQANAARVAETRALRRQENPATAHESDRRWRAKNPHAPWLKRRYGLTLAQYDAMLQVQGGGCAVCGGPQANRRCGDRFCVDHDHATGRIRGLLCGPCNLAIGYFQDRPDLLRAAAAYLERCQVLTLPAAEALARRAHSAPGAVGHVFAVGPVAEDRLA